MQQPGPFAPVHVIRRWSGIVSLVAAGFASGLAGTSASGAPAVGRLAAEFGVDATGAATYTLPVNVAGGRGGLRPTIGLRYASHDGDGLAGVGFTVTGLSRITRCPLTIAVDGRAQGVRFATGDRYCLDGQPLVLVAGTYGGDGAEYRTEINNLQRVVSRGRQGSGPASFDVQHPDGQTWRYGNDADSRLEAVGIASEVREWVINQISDKFENQIAFTWLDDQATGESLPVEIRWTGDAAGTGARFRLVFGYEPRPAEDQRQLQRWGASWQSLKRLSFIRYEFDGGTGFGLVHRYTLTYATGNGGRSRRSQLTSIQQCGPTECLPATTFGWQTGMHGFEAPVAGPTDTLAGDALFADHDGDGDADLYLPVTVSGTQRWHTRLANAAGTSVYASAPINTGVARYGMGRVLEYDGDGRRDLLAQGPGSPAAWFVHRSNGTGGFLTAVNTGLSTATAPSPLVADVNGDGLDDLVYSRDYVVRIRHNTGSGFGPELTTSLGTTVNGGTTLLPLLDGSGGAPDFDGDGRQDLLILRGTLSLSGPPWYYEGFLSTGTDFQALFTTPPALDAVALDLNGDGLTDLAYRDRALGWQTRRSLGNALAAPEATGISTNVGHVVRVVDVDSDGRDDLIRRLDDSTWRVHLAGGGSGGPAQGPVFSNVDAARYFDLTGGPAPGATARLAPADVTGDGLPDLVFAENTGRWQVRKHSGPRPDLLVKAVDGLGNVFEPAYEPLATFAGYTRNGAAGAGEYLLRGGPLAVVTRYTGNDGIGGTYTSSYAYWNGKMNRLGRGFLGFEKIRATDSRYAAIHGVAVFSEVGYHQTFPLIGVPDLLTTERSDGRKLSVRNPTWGARAQSSAPSDSAGDYHFPYLQSETQEEYESDPDAGGLGQLVRTLTRTLTYDFNHGLPVREATAVSSPASPGIFNTTVATVFDDAPRTAQYCLGLPLRVDTTRDVSSASASTRTTQYSWSATTCRQLTDTTGAPGALAKQLVSSRTWSNTGQLTELSRSPADQSAPARRTIWTYATWSDRPQTETALISGQASPVVRSEWNHGLDVELSRTSPRSQVARWSWDDFARLRQETRADGPATTYSYSGCAGACISARGEYQLRAVRSDGFVSTSIHDRYGRTVAQEVSLAGGQTSRQLLEFDALGRLARQTVPYVTGEAQFWVENSYDVSGQRRAEERPAAESGGNASTRWNSNRLTRTVRDAEYRVSTHTLDAEGRLIGVVSATGGTANYSYTAFGELASVTDANGSRTTLSYDERGLPTTVESPDNGRRTSDYNAFGELLTQADALTPANVISFSYDQLGRLIQRNDSGQGLTNWEFNTASGPLLGLPSRVTAPVGTNPAGFSEQYAYDALGRRTAVTTTLEGTTYVTNYGWDALGRVTSMIYPATVNGARLHLGLRYDAGYADIVEQDVLAGGGLWLKLYDLQGQDALGRERLVRLGSSTTIDEQRDFDRASTRLKAIRTGAAMGSQLQNYRYLWDKVGNLTQRQDLGQGLTEDFGYDEQNRLLSARLNGTLTLALDYDAGGRIRSKSDVGTYAYGGSHPGAVTAVSGGPAGSRSYVYNANGNMSARQGKSISWHPFPLPKRIDYGTGDFAEFAYGPDRQRIRQIARTGAATITTWYIGPHFEVEINGTQRRYRSTVFANGEAIYSQLEQATPATFEAYFLHRDHQGSVDTLSRVVGAGAQTLPQRFDVFGKRRNPNWSADPADIRAADSHFLERGYTGHEHLDNVRLIHMNGRLQDPVLGTMLAPDPVLGSLLNPQSLNRYAYVADNPGSLVDPSGFLFGRIGKFFKRLVSGIGSLVRRVIDNYGREILAAVASYYSGGAASQWYAASVPAATAVGAGTVGAIAGGAVAGGIVTGDLRGAAVGVVGGAGFGAIGAAYGNTWSLERIGASALVGGTAAQISGGDFRRGLAFSGGAAAFGYAYDRVVNYEATWSPGGAAQGKQRLTMPIEDANNFAESRAVVDPSTFMGEGGRMSRFMNRIPGMNAIAGMHDFFQVRLEILGGDRFGQVLRSTLSYPGMPVAAGLTYPALFDGVPSMAAAIDD